MVIVIELPSVGKSVGAFQVRIFCNSVIIYKIHPMLMWLRKNPVLKPLKYVKTHLQQTHSHLFQCAKVINCAARPGHPLESWLTEKMHVVILDMCICLG